jgi:FkbM family methyltransferase
MTPQSILEIGSRDGHDAEKLRKEFKISPSNVHVVEPNPDLHDQIQNQYPEFNLHKVAISNTTGELDFNKVPLFNGEGYVGTSSLLNRTDDLYKELRSETVKVKAITGEDLLKSIQLREVDICKIDVEGLTYEVLSSFGEAIKRIKTLQIECEHTHMWEGQKLYSDVREFILSVGFSETFFTYSWRGQSDSVFVRNDVLK